MKIKTSKATPRQLDWLVAKLKFDSPAIHGGVVHAAHEYMPWAPSTDWSQGGPIIEREQIQLSTLSRGQEWRAALIYNQDIIQYGPTPLVAAMRCFVASKLGEEVEVPDELC